MANYNTGFVIVVFISVYFLFIFNEFQIFSFSFWLKSWVLAAS